MVFVILYTKLHIMIKDTFTQYEFIYNGEDVKWAIKENNTASWVPETKDLRFSIQCGHPIFLEAFGSPGMIATSLSELIHRGKEAGYCPFFEAMQGSFN